MNIVQKIIRRWYLLRFCKHEKNRLDELQKTIDVIIRECKRAKDANLEHFVRIYNVALFLLVFEYDTSILSQQYLSAYTKSWEKKFIAREMALLLCEVSEDIPQLLGGNFRISLKTIPLWEEANNELNTISKELSRFRQQNSKSLRNLRNFVVAHRDHDAIKQLDIIDVFDPDNIFKLSGDFSCILKPFIPFIIRLVHILGDQRVIIHHLFKRNMD